jgi:hypothetical protein
MKKSKELQELKIKLFELQLELTALTEKLNEAYAEEERTENSLNKK